jgi:catalase-peroxidase
MAMNDEETVALIAGGHTFGKTHGAGVPNPTRERARGREDRSAGPGLGQQLRHRHRRRFHRQRPGRDLDADPAQWSNDFFENLFKFEWEQTRSPAGAIQWEAKGAEAVIPDAFDPSKKRKPTMLTTDLSLRFDPAYEKISRRFPRTPGLRRRLRPRLVQADPSRHGPRSRYLGPEVPKEELIWQDPVPPSTIRWSTPPTSRR